MQSTPNANRLHVAIFGRRNSGKSSLLNSIVGQDASVVSDVAGTTTDAVARTMELHGVGSVLFIDTPGFDDYGELGAQRVQRAIKSIERTDMAFLLCEQGDMVLEQEWLAELKQSNIPVVAIINKTDIRDNITHLKAQVEREMKLTPLCVSAKSGVDIELIREAILRHMPADYAAHTIVGDLVQAGDSVLLVMPQDRQAPKGRLILPQVQTLRELLDIGAVVVSSNGVNMEQCIAAMAAPPKLIITDSQIFKSVYERKPAASRLTSFSLLMAGYKGDIPTFIEGAAAIDKLTPCSRILIAEACTHAPLSEDIGREKIPALLRARVGASLQVDIVAGRNFPDSLVGYDLIIHCGGCMFNRRYMLARIERARAAGVPITNYGVAIAHLGSILEKVVYPKKL